MDDRHWTDDELVARLYEVREDDGHLDRCAECGTRWRQLNRRRDAIVRTPAISDEFLRAQRSAVFDRLDTWQLPRFVPALAMGLLLVAASALQGPAPKPQPSIAVATSDARLFEDVFSEVSRDEPHAITPLHGLFEVKP